MATYIKTETGGMVSAEPQEIDGQTWMRLTITHAIGSRSALLNPAEIERIVAALVASQRPEQAGEAERLRAYAMALRGDLVEIDAAFSEDDTDHLLTALTRHVRGTLDEDVAALAQTAGGEPHIPPLASYPGTLEITEVRAGVPLPPEEADRG